MSFYPISITQRAYNSITQNSVTQRVYNSITQRAYNLKPTIQEFFAFSLLNCIHNMKCKFIMRKCKVIMIPIK